MIPHETLLVADSLTGQDAVRTAEAFHGAVSVTGIVLTRLDGDAEAGSTIDDTSHRLPDKACGCW